MVWIGVVLAIILAVNIKPASYAAAYKALSAIGGKLPSFSWLPGLAERGAFFALGFLVCMQFGGVIPPGPDPDPDPEPEPIVDDAPFPADGLTVLIVEETEDRDTIPASQLGVLSSMDVRNAAGGNIRLYDDDVPIQEQGPWQAAMDAWRASGKPTPAIAISNGKTGIIDALPTTITATVEMIGRFD